ncbi:calcium/proton exchanger [Synechococcus sp. AH-551-A21]|nr:calcium/proton exchanger [Synechococcus sp. AH-551-A21]MDB4677833.1 calcium/proton exchanger [Synechococcus sp. AH-551-A21]
MSSNINQVGDSISENVTSSFLKSGRWKLIPALTMLGLTQLASMQEWPTLICFIVSATGIIPIALLLSDATEEIAEHSGPTIGAICTAIFGNFAEFIIALSALRLGLIDVVKASITGAILSDLLLVTGVAMLVGGLKYSEQSFQETMVRTNGAAMTLAVMAMALPASLISTSGIDDPVAIHGLSMTVAVILIAIYFFTLIFSLATHNHLFDPQHVQNDESESVHAAEKNINLLPWIIQLILCTSLLAYQSESFVHFLEPATEQLGFSALFTGIIIIPIIGGFSEYVPAVKGALKDQMDLPISLAMGSSLLVALLIAPALIIIGTLIGQPMDLDFTAFEVIALIFSVLIVNLVNMDAKSNWLEGVLLLGMFSIFGAAFYYYPS